MKDKLETLLGSFYGWEYCLENDLQPTITREDIDNLDQILSHYGELLRREEKLNQTDGGIKL